MKRVFLLLALVAYSLAAQQGGFVSGAVRDRSGDPISAADVRVQNQETGTRQVLRTTTGGEFTTNELTSGSYKITVRRDGFRTITQEDIAVSAGKTLRVDFDLDVLPLQQEVTVSAVQSDVDPTASGLTMTREAPAASLPVNGRDVHALFSIMPGATVTPASISAGGQFTVSGQRPNANSFRVDGMNANIGVGIVAVPGALPGDTLPGMSTIGGMQSLASKEETETVELRTADFDPEFGDRPGAQINISTRAGSNDFHGAVFGYIRPHTFDSQDWFARAASASLPSAALNGWGGGLGGPLWRKRTFFFAAFERTDVHDNALQIIAVPSLAARANPLLLPYLPLFNAFPSPTGPALNASESVAFSPLQKAGAVTNRSIRIDQTFGSKWQAFARYSDVPSSSTSVELGTAYSAFHWRSVTAGANRASGSLAQQLRFNFTQASAKSLHGPEDESAVNRLFNGPLSGYFNFWQFAQVSMAGVGRTVFGAAAEGQGRQFEGGYILAWQRGKQDLRLGGDYEKIKSSSNADSHYVDPDPAIPSFYSSTASIVSPGIDALLAGVPLGLTSSNGAYPGFDHQRFSIFAEDSLRVTDRFSVLLGLRWDVTFPLDYLTGLYPAFFGLGYWRGEGSSPLPITNNFTFAQSSWPLRFGQVAPRLGLAYRLKPSALVIRAGAGLFYDTGLGSVVSNTNPLTIWQYLPTAASPAIPPDFSSYPSPPLAVLSLPRVWEWKASVEKSFSEQSLFSLSYLGARGTKLVRNQATEDVPSGVLETTQFASTGSSSYHALLANGHANLSPNLFALVSYTLGHSIDNGSSDTLPVLVNGAANKGSSSFDVRQVFSASIGYRTPDRLGHALGGWALSSTSLARTGFPFDVKTVDQSIGLGLDNSDRANLVPGQPVWIYNNSAPGGRALNPAAFQVSAVGSIGPLGRNSLTGFGLFQTDVSLRKQLRLYRGASAAVMLSAFNLLNHPSFANPINYLGSALFGQPTAMTNLMLGSGSPTTGLTPLFQAGGPRTIELSLRFSF